MELSISELWNGSPADVGEGVTLRLAGDAAALVIEVAAPFFSDPEPPGPRGPFFGLWEYEVVELFILGAGERYTEVELGPHGHHLVLKLEGRRRIIESCLPLGYEARIDGARWLGTARLDRGLLPSAPHRLNAYAIHGTGPGRRYLAWRAVPGAQPDFHRLECFEGCVLP